MHPLPPFHLNKYILANFWECCWGGGGDDPPLWIAVGGHSARRPFRHTFVLFFYHLKHICLIHRILNERKTSHLYQYCLYLYKNKEIYMYWVLFVVLLDLQQGLVVLKSSLFSIIWQFVGHGGWKFLFGGPAGGDGMWGVMTLCGGVTLEWGVSWQLWNK